MVGVLVTVGVAVFVGVLVDVLVGVLVGVLVWVGVGVLVGVLVSVAVSVAVGLFVTVGVAGPTELLSYAPTSHVVSAPEMRTNPRWSRLFTGAAVHTVVSPAPMATLLPPSAIVCVGPPLLASACRAICPLVAWVALPQVLSSARLWLSAVSVPKLKQSLPDVLLAMMVLWSVAVPLLARPPPLLALLPEKVLLLTVSVALVKRAPPKDDALLAEKVLLLMVVVPPPLAIAPPPRPA